jgi:polyphosphate kinase 2 (PPK2 family)
MIERTSTDHAPWVLVEAEDKRWARVKTMKTVCKHLEKALAD